MKLLQYYHLLRVPHYIKNFFVFTPVLFSQQYTEFNISQTMVAFVTFSLLASSVYIFNDLMDLAQDQQHPRKRFRPLASGKIKKPTAIYLMLFLLATTFSISLILPVTVFYLLLAYLILNIAYSLKLKQLVIIDLFIIAIGFVLRVVVGAQAADVYLSMWLIIMTFLLALFLAISKRRDDVLLALKGQNTRKNIDGYNLEFVNAGMVVMSAVLIVCYILYTISAEVVERLAAPHLYLSTFFVILGIMRYMQITFVHETSESPTTIVLGDKFLQITLLLWLLSYFGLSQI